MQIKIGSNFEDVRRQFAHMAKQVNFAGAVALTRTAVDVKAEIVRQLPRIINNPTRYTMNSLRVSKATRQKLFAEVWFKGADAGDPKAPLHYLNALITGGKRRTKRFEGRLIMHGKLKRGERLVPIPKPAGGAEMDAHGNVNTGQITKILSQLKTAVVQGDYSNASDSKRSAAKRAVEQYFWSDGVGTPHIYIRTSKDASGRVVRKRVVSKSALKRGVWVVRRTAFGNAVRPVFIAVTRANYKKSFDMFGIAAQVQQRVFGKHFDKAFQEALKTAIYTQQKALF
jgi:hypothetical protein